MLVPLPPAIVLAATATPAPAQIVVAKGSGDAVIIWNATATVTDLKTKSVPPDEAMRELEALAAGYLVERGSGLPAAQSVSIRVVYPGKPEFNSQYGVEITRTVNRLFTLKAAKAALGGAKGWAAALKAGTIPKDLTLEVTGSFPTDS